MSTHPRTGWADHAHEVLKHEGYSRGGAREAVIEYLDRQDCAASAQEIHQALRAAGRSIGMASVYRSLEALHGLHLVQRFDAGHGEGRYEAVAPGGDHHHHVVCDDCDRILPFEDPALEKAIHKLAERVPYAIAGHDVVLHGRCPDCQKG
jgi:Fur family ferric uptake transcriptional regulator